ncbi:MAG: endonuclease III [Treponema sp.]|nr:endonuclease III [Treponema sp.]
MGNEHGIEWNKIITALEKWRDDVSAQDPSVTTVAEHYKKNTDIDRAWAVLISTIISLRTKDEVTLLASRRLLEKAGNPAKLCAMRQSVIEKLIYPAGFYRNKAASLKKIAAILIDKYDGKVPSNMDELLALPGVGRKTANLVLSEAFDLDAICVDIHVHRISNRCGWLKSGDPEETEMILREILPRKYWKRINYLLVLYGQKLCRPVSPFCSICVIKKYCACNGVEKSR